MQPAQTRPSLGNDVYRRLVAWLADSALPAGTRLPSEHELARQFAISRPILRQALARLQAEGRLYARKGSGNFVKQVAAGPPLITYDALANIPDVQRFLEFRCSLEGEIAA